MIILLMGVAGTGKTTVGTLLAKKLGWSFYDGDDFHPPENITKMEYGVPLTDEDRAGWLARLQQLIQDCLQQRQAAVIACSALKQSYRDFLQQGNPQIHIVYLKGSPTLIAQRLQARTDHFMPPQLLDSQFMALEEPQGVLTLDITRPPQALVQEIRETITPNNRKTDS